MVKKNHIFDELMEGFEQAIAQKKRRKKSLLANHPAGVPSLRLRVTEIPRVKPMKPREIRGIRLALGASQSVFAHVLNVSPKVVQSWEHGARRPTSAALKLLSIARCNPRILLEPSEVVSRTRKRVSTL